MILELFAGIPVRAFEVGREWHDRFWGRQPDFLAHPTEAVWELAPGRSVYVDEDPARAGHAVLTFFVDDLDAFVAGVAGRGIEPAKQETHGNGVRKITFRDPDGNEIGVGGAPE